MSGAENDRRHEVIAAFLAASRAGDFEALLALLDPKVVIRSDLTAVRAGAASEVRGAPSVARTFLGRAREARMASIDGAVGLAWAPDGKPRVLFDFTIAEGKVVAIDMIANAAAIDRVGVGLD